jgi:exopolysaccharide production protein ExoQ
MPSALALLICTIFVLFLLWIERKQSPEASIALWIPTIWMLSIASKPLGIWFQLSDVTMEEGSPLDRAFLTALLCLGLIILAKRNFNWSNAIKENIWLIVLIGYMLISCLWSDIPFISLKRCSKELIAVVMAFVVASEPDPRKSLESLFRRIIYIIIPFSYILIHYFPEYGRMYVHHEGLLMWTGVAMHKNSLSQLCLFAAFFLIWTIIRRQQGRDTSAFRYQTILEVFILILTFWLLGGPQQSFTYSATTTVALTVGLSALVGLFWNKKWGNMLGPKALIVLIAFIIIYGTITPMLGRLSLMDLSSTLGREETLTGRTSVWGKVVPIAMKRPIIGSGFGSFWTTTTREVFDISGAHSGYLDVILDLGFVGLLLYAIFLLSSILKAQRMMTQDFDWGALWICCLLMVVVHNITESSLNTFTFILMANILLLTVSSTTATSYTLGDYRELRHIAT